MTPTLLHTENLSIGYAKKGDTNVIASGVALHFGQGKLFALIGANGIGKSTLLRTLTGIQQPLDGVVSLHKKNISAYTSSELAQQLSLVLTEKLPPSNLTVFELIALGRQPYTNWLGTLTPNDLEKINEAMALTDTAALSQKKHHELSDGQLQKVLIARALAQDTPLIVLDEPTTHLDLQHKISLLRLLRKLAHDAQKCIVFSTHDIEMAMEVSDEIVLMTPGKITQATPKDLMAGEALNGLFTDPNIRFDAEKVKFVFTDL